MDVLNVYAVFKTLSGLTEGEASPYLAMCSASAKAIEHRLTDDCDHMANSEILTYAAGCEAYYRYVLGSAATEPTGSFKAGDVSVSESHSERLSAAERLRQTALDDIRSLCFDPQFDFRTVEIS